MRGFKAGLLAVAMVAAPGLAHAEWTKTYVIEWIETAAYFGASSSGVTDPGTDCPTGVNPEPNWVQMLVNAGYTQQEAEWIRNPENPERSAVSGNPRMGLRGRNKTSVYRDPESYPDPGLVEVTGGVSEGINLDGDASTGLRSPSGEAGIDNEFYRALGCWKTFRGKPRTSSGSLTVNDTMRNGSWALVIVVHGQGNDPMNDENVTVGIYQSADPMIRGGDNAIMRDYTFAIQPHAQNESIYPARVRAGRITSTAPINTMMRDPSPGSVRAGMELLRAQIDFTVQPDGTLKGYIGGYRPWQPVYFGWSGFGQVNEVLTWIDLPAAWYAMKRHADFSPTPGGERTHISFALRVDAVPAYVTTPDRRQDVAQVVSYKTQAAAAPAAAPRPVASGAAAARP